ncbi:hypothetical protein PIIN_11150 [Serendipita indica DSM 11827]|uniref:Uncharacterized protein n=1 Tax=Serendipita indica (strain DSM 11827) TaxID=1109443 RepID=G4U0S5_SERID|nr:hypothetical protein PIIN_11150 [Serendipita indica DSM 11827]
MAAQFRISLQLPRKANFLCWLIKVLLYLNQAICFTFTALNAAHWIGLRKSFSMDLYTSTGSTWVVTYACTAAKQQSLA